MSAFLGFIHHLMWGKINFVEDLVDDIINQASKSGIEIREAVNSVGTVEKGDLAELIEHSNIHGWLSQRVDTAEERLAKATQLFLENGSIDELKDVFRIKGESENFSGSKVEAYQLMTSKFLDGMPCDGSLRVLAQEDDVVFLVSNDVHKSIWDRYSGVDLYWELRDEFVKGMLKNTNYNYEKDGAEYAIRG